MSFHIVDILSQKGKKSRLISHFSGRFPGKSQIVCPGNRKPAEPTAAGSARNFRIKFSPPASGAFPPGLPRSWGRCIPPPWCFFHSSKGRASTPHGWRSGRNPPLSGFARTTFGSARKRNSPLEPVKMLFMAKVCRVGKNSSAMPLLPGQLFHFIQQLAEQRQRLVHRLRLVMSTPAPFSRSMGDLEQPPERKPR